MSRQLIDYLIKSISKVSYENHKKTWQEVFDIFLHYLYIVYTINKYVVATTHQNGTCNILTSAKLLVGYLVVRITRELNKEPSLYCYPIYISYKWSILQQCVYLMSTLQWLYKTMYPALMSMCPTYGNNVVYMLPNVIV